MRESLLITRIAAVLVLVLAIAFSVQAQSNKATIVGTVKDPNDALVKGAKATVTNVATGELREATSGDLGEFTVTNLEPGKYRVSVDAPGFQSVVLEEVTVETNARVPLNIKFRSITGSTGTVTVTAESAPLTESETSVRGDIITGKQVTDLPLAQRNFTLLAGLVPGVTRPLATNVGVLGGGNLSGPGAPNASTESTRFRESGGSVISANGARVTNNNFTLDGVDNNESQFGQIGIFPPPDAIAEFKVETSVPSADSGRAGGAIVSTTLRSGGNSFHGTLFENYQGHFGSAKPTNVPDPPNFVKHNYGGTVGGPLFLPRFGEGGKSYYNGRNRSFFFFSYNAQKFSTPAFGGTDFPFVTVPTARMRVGDFGELLKPGTSMTYTRANGTTFTAPIGTIFDANSNPIPGNDLRLCTTCPPLSRSGLATLQAYPLPTESGLFNNFRRNRKEKSDDKGYDVRIDHKLTSKNSAFGRFSFSNLERLRDNNFPLGTSPNGNDLPSGFGAGDEFGKSRQVALSDTHIFTPTVVNEARAGYTRVNLGIFNPGVGGALGFKSNVSSNLGMAGVNVCGLNCSGVVLLGVVDSLNGSDRSLEFVGDGGPFYFLSNNFHFGDTLNITKGVHGLKFGGDLRVRQNTQFDGGRTGGTKGNVQYGSSTGGFASFLYNGIGPNDSGSALANLLLGYSPGQITRGNPGGPFLLSNKEIDFFVQDDWKVNQNLTLNLGLRYDVFTPAHERFDQQSNFDPSTGNLIRAGSGNPLGRNLVHTDKNNFGPRIGFAYSGLRKDRKLVLRGGYGLLYATDTSGQLPLTANPPSGASYSCNLSNYGTAGCPQLPARFNFDTGYPYPQPPTVTAAVFPAPSGQNIFFIDPNLKTEMYHEYNLTAQWEFRPNWLAELGYVASRGRDLLVIKNIGNGTRGSRQVTNIDTVTTTVSTGQSWYDSLQAKLNKRLSKGLSILSTYTWAHAIDNSPGGFCIGGTGPASCGPANPLRPELDKGNSDLDVRHRFTFSSVYDLPIGRARRFGSGMSRTANALVGGWQLNNIVTIQSGPVYSVTDGSARVDLVGDPFANLAPGREINRAAFRSPVTPIFANDPSGPKFGTLGRNTFRGQSQGYWDASLFKIIPVTRISEAFRMELRFQAYNVLNHINHSVPSHDIGDHDFFGIDRTVQQARQLEWALKILF